MTKKRKRRNRKKDEKEDEKIAVKVENTTQSFVDTLKGKIKNMLGKDPEDERRERSVWYLLFSKETVEAIQNSELKDQISGTVSKSEFLSIPIRR